MKQSISKISFAVMLALLLCTIDSFHIEEQMLPRVRVSVPRDGILQGIKYEDTILPMSSLVNRDGHTGVYLLDYVDAAFGRETIVHYVEVTVGGVENGKFVSSDLLPHQKYVVRSSRPLKNGEKVNVT